MGPMRKLVLINLLNAPFYFYFYHDINLKYINLQKHLVKKYLIIGEELLNQGFVLQFILVVL